MPFITAENAAGLAKLAQEARRVNKQLQTRPVAKECYPQADRYILRQLLRVRRQIDSVFGMLEAEMEPQGIDRLASALARLNEIERQLANRPLPGSLKPSQGRPMRAALAEPTPTPQVVVQPVQPKP